MNISLSRNVKLHCYDILMDMGIKTDKRPDIVAVTKRAQELGGSITPEIICKDLINRPKAISAGRNILQRCQDLDLFDDRGRLTEEGQRTAEEETVFMPETGTYRIWFTEDPLIPNKFITFKPVFDGSIRSDVFTNGNAKEKKNELVNLPDWIQQCTGKEVRALGDGKIIKIYSMEATVRRVPNHSKNFDVILEIPQFLQPSLKIKSSTWEEPLDVKSLPINIEFDAIWRSLLGDDQHQWTGNHFQIPMDQITDSEKKLFRKDMPLTSPMLEHLGTFSDTVVLDVPIAPISPEEANLWANFLLHQRIQQYMNPQEYNQLSDEIVSRDEFGYFQDSVSLPGQHQMSQSFFGKDSSKSKQYWYLQAPLDLTLQEEAHE